MVYYWLDWDWPGSEAAFRRALVLDPSSAHACRMLGVLLGTAGRHAEARAAMQHARELDPLQPLNHALSAHIALLARDYSAGLEFARQATVVGPAFWIGYFQLAWAHERLGNMELALEALKDADTFSSDNSKMISLRGYILATAGRRNEAAEVLSTLEAMAHERYVPPYAFALVYAGLEQHERALEWLEHAYTVRDVHLIWLPMDARWDAFRTESAFVGLIERCGFTRSTPTP